MKYATSWSDSAQGGDGEMRWTVGEWLAHVATRARDLLFARRRRHRPVQYGGREFSTPQLLSEALLPRSPGLFAIQVRHWWSGLTPIHFGASNNLHEELVDEGHEWYVHWLGQRGARRGLWVSYHVADDLAHHEARHQENTRLIRRYFPRRTHSLDEHLATHRNPRSAAHRRATHGRDDRSDD